MISNVGVVGISGGPQMNVVPPTWLNTYNERQRISHSKLVATISDLIAVLGGWSAFDELSKRMLPAKRALKIKSNRLPLGGNDLQSEPEN